MPCNPTLALTEELIACASITPHDAGCQALMMRRLSAVGFECHAIESGPADFRVSNLWAMRRGAAADATCLVFAGHTDVVPTGPLDQWLSNPFVPTHRNGLLYGRGAADMKSSLAAMVVAAEEFVLANPTHAGSLAFLITSDEEGPARDGTVKVCEWLQAQNIKLDYCIVGEPTSLNRLGDVVKNGRRGSFTGLLKVHGVQGHIAYPHLAQNPIHLAMPALAELAQMEWDKGNTYFQPTSWQMSNIHAGDGTNNVIPGVLEVRFNFRFSTESTPQSLRERLVAVLDRHGLKHTIAWTLGGEPFLTPVGELSHALCAAIQEHTGQEAELSTSGGTSDGRFIAKMCPQVMEFGPLNATIHQINECVEVAGLEPLKNVYRGVMDRLLVL